MMTTEARGRGEFRNDFSIVLDTNEPTDNKVTALATVLFRKRHAPDSPKIVIFTLNDAEYSRKETEEEGRASEIISLPGPGSYRLVVQIEGMPGVRVSRLLTVKEAVKKSKEPKSLGVRILGPRGSQKLLVSVAGEGGKPIEGFEGLIVDDGNLIAFLTNEFGIYEHATNVKPKDELAIRVRVSDAPGLEWSGVLIGG